MKIKEKWDSMTKKEKEDLIFLAAGIGAGLSLLTLSHLAMYQIGKEDGYLDWLEFLKVISENTK